MATYFNKTYTLVVKYTKGTLETIVDTDADAVIFRAKILKWAGEIVPASQGDLNAQQVSIAEA